MSGKSRIGICFVDLTNFLKAIFLNDIDSEYFFWIYKIFLDCPFSASVPVLLPSKDTCNMVSSVFATTDSSVMNKDSIRIHSFVFHID